MIKLIGAIVIIMLGLLLEIKEVGETEDNIFFQDYIHQENKEDPSISEEIHSSADTKDICGFQDPLCLKIKTPQIDTIIPYKNETHTVAYFINTNQTSTKKIVDTLNQIEIKDDESGKRGYATRYNVVVNVNPVESMNEFNNLITHELGHIFDLGVIQGDKPAKNKLFTEFNKSVFAVNDASLLFYKLSRDSENIRKKGSVKKDFCSGYGMSNPFEDFAECFNLFINSQSFFKTIAKQNPILEKKYNFIATTLKGKYRDQNLASLSKLKEKKDWRPRDTTKL